jgi:hypothetical protein
MNNGNPSGFTLSKADYWVFYCHDEFLIIQNSFLGMLLDEVTEKEYQLNDNLKVIKTITISSIKKYGTSLSEIYNIFGGLK